MFKVCMTFSELQEYLCLCNQLIIKVSLFVLIFSFCKLSLSTWQHIPSIHNHHDHDSHVLFHPFEMVFEGVLILIFFFKKSV